MYKYIFINRCEGRRYTDLISNSVIKKMCSFLCGVTAGFPLLDMMHD